MSSLNPELIAESLVLVVYTVIAGVLTVGGLAVEYTSFQHLGAGELTVGLWMAALGAIMLYAGLYGIAYQKVLAKLLARTH